MEDEVRDKEVELKLVDGVGKNEDNDLKLVGVLA